VPEYLAPGVYVEEVSFRSKSIEGVGTSTAGFVGPTRYGPVGGDSQLVTSFPEFSRLFGGLDTLQFEDPTDPTNELPAADNYMGHGVRAFFDNGGTRLYISRIYHPLGDPADDENSDIDADHRGKASWTAGSPVSITLRARFPGVAGNMTLRFSVVAGPNRLVGAGNMAGLSAYALVYLRQLDGTGAATPAGLYDAVRQLDGTYNLTNRTTSVAVADLNATQYNAHLVTVNVTAELPGRFGESESFQGLQAHPDAGGSLTAMFALKAASRRQYLETPFVIETTHTSGADLLTELVGQSVIDLIEPIVMGDRELRRRSPFQVRPAPSALTVSVPLQGGSDGAIPKADDYKGAEIGQAKTGLLAFEDVDEIAIVAAPGSSAKYGIPTNPLIEDQQAAAVANELQIHVEKMRYRVAVLDSRDNEVLSEVQDYRGRFDSKYMAFYYPWVKTIDPLDPDGRREVNLPPSGYVAGIYARNDVLHGVVKAPANEVVLGAIGFETLLNKAQQDILNPLGINCFRYFQGRGYRLWGARTISSDPEWKYISVRRYFAYLEHSIDKGTQWAVFENNGPALWANVTQAGSDFLINEWHNGALLGNKPEEAFFVRCDRSTMTQNNLDNGQLVCLIGVAVVKPAEFVIFRIGQMTADARR
jgi:phage tail sheath protein FI